LVAEKHCAEERLQKAHSPIFRTRRATRVQCIAHSQGRTPGSLASTDNYSAKLNQRRASRYAAEDPSTWVAPCRFVHPACPSQLNRMAARFDNSRNRWPPIRGGSTL